MVLDDLGREDVFALRDADQTVPEANCGLQSLSSRWKQPFVGASWLMMSRQVARPKY
jgi:hypothetical protein